MDLRARQTLDELRRLLHPASVAQVGGFRPPQDPVTSWFCRGVGHSGEELPFHDGEPMFPLLQIRTDELPWRPPALDGVALLVLFHNLHHYPFGKPHGEGWLIREYAALEGLRPLPARAHPYRPFPIRWQRVDDDAPGWETTWNLVDLSAVNEDDAANDAFFNDFERYRATKVGGYPCEIQHGTGGLDEFVFQVGLEEKVNWMWADNGIGYFFRSASGEWRWSCQFY
ncbi:DUF1963 domain-containing protein [Tahibacter harae]|uniref:YwqG family protein n=1 Tax=Tahibacter harae TaxID=2963937 RepID=A0ABT1QRC5_9GAMM|nr:DUF1963 domain-containing protein [Tahibacter harae]MCQ4164855.1 YwqG family protein [Tahibacter harae]